MKTTMSSKADKCWLSISIFCNMFHWHQLYTTIIKPMLRMRLISQWDVKMKLYDERHCLDLALEVPKSKSKKISIKIDQLLKSFLEQLPSEKISEEAPYENEQIFMPFRNNTVQYGLHKVKRKLPIDATIHNSFKQVTKKVLKTGTEFEDILLISYRFYTEMILKIIGNNDALKEQLLDRIEKRDLVINRTEFNELYYTEKEFFDNLTHEVKKMIDLGERALFRVFDRCVTYDKTTICVKYMDIFQEYIWLSNFMKWSLIMALVNALAHEESTILT